MLIDGSRTEGGYGKVFWAIVRAGLSECWEMCELRTGWLQYDDAEMGVPGSS
jgi:hypothetical protein